MFLRLSYFTIFLCAFVQVNSTLFFGNSQYDPNVEPSKLGDLLRSKAQFVDKVKSRLFGNSNPQHGSISVEGSSTGFTVGTSGTGGYNTDGSGPGGFSVGAGYSTGGSAPGFSAEGSTSGSVNAGRTGVLTQSLNKFSESLSSSLAATGRFIDSGVAAGKQYGKTIFHGATIVPKTIYDLAVAHHQNAYLTDQSAQSLTYVSNDSDYLFQFVDENAHVFPITAEVANRLVPGFLV